jgi:hypothetical protein
MRLIKKVQKLLRKTLLRETKRIGPLHEKSRYGDTRLIHQIGANTYLIEGHARYCRGAVDEKGNQTMFDFEGGPCYVLGHKFPFEDSPTAIVKLRSRATNKEDWASVVVTVA